MSQKQTLNIMSNQVSALSIVDGFINTLQEIKETYPVEAPIVEETVCDFLRTTKNSTSTSTQEVLIAADSFVVKTNNPEVKRRMQVFINQVNDVALKGFERFEEKSKTIDWSEWDK